MDKDIAMRWADALESGEYQQGRGRLRRAGKFCCLGVLCNLHAQAHPEIAAAQKKATQYMGDTLGLAQDVSLWAGMDGNGLGEFGFTVGDAPGAVSLANLNDRYKFSFKQIAEVIRKHYKGL